MIKKTAALVLAALLSSASCAQEAPGTAVVVYQTEGEYEFIVDNVKNAVIGRGMVVSGTLHVSDMLGRTAADLGYSGQPYAKAESIEFCSAPLSQRMTRADVRNVVICPFTVAVYVLPDAPDTVHVAYRRPRLAGAAQEVEREVVEMLDGIAREAVE